MTILLKDFKYETITSTSGSTAGTAGYASTTSGTSSGSTLSYYYIPDGWTQLEDGRWIDAEGQLQTNPAITDYGLYYPNGFVGDAPSGDATSGAKGIYLATSVQDNDMMRSLYPNDWDNTESDVVARTYHHQVVWYNGKNELGVAKYTYPDGNYLAFWFGFAGYGLYYFVGYTAAKPTQTLSTESGTFNQASYDALMEQILQEDRSTWIWGDGKVDADGVDGPTSGDSWGTFFDLTPSDGYESQPLVDTSSGTYNDGTALTGDQTTTNVSYTVETVMPAQDATVGTSTPLTYTQILKLTNSGWNSWARSINPLNAGTFIKFTAASGVTSACITIANKGMEGAGVARFTHGIICDSSGVRVYENGAMVKTLYATQTALSELRIYRQSSNTIVYMAITGTSSVVHTSTVPAKSLLIPLYAYGYLYTAGDRISSAVFKTGEVQYGSV